MTVAFAVSRAGAQPAQLDAPELQGVTAEIREGMLQEIDPDLLRQAAVKGIYRRNDYPVLRSMNPFFVRGDFNGDGAPDLAFWVTQRSSGLTGVIVLHSTLDAVYYLGAGHGTEDISSNANRGEVAADAWRVLPRGSVVRAFATVPEIGAVEGRPFTFAHDALQFHWLGKSSFAFCWVNGRYWQLWTGD
jgi:hypothetical protein